MAKTKSSVKPTLAVILGDQLSPSISSLDGLNPAQTIVLMVEVWDETTYVRHHKKKIAFVLSAMRHFAEDLRAAGWTVEYVKLDDPGNSGSFTGEVERAIGRHKPARVVVTEASEYRVTQMQAGWAEQFGLPVEIKTDTRFLWTRDQFTAWARGRKMLRMEHFYHEVRRSTGYLMEEGGKPTGGDWNYDSENRKPAKDDMFMPDVPRFKPDALTAEVLTLVAVRFGNHIGDLEPFWFAVTRADALKALNSFIRVALPNFGDFKTRW